MKSEVDIQDTFLQITFQMSIFCPNIKKTAKLIWHSFLILFDFVIIKIRNLESLTK